VFWVTRARFLILGVGLGVLALGCMSSSVKSALEEFAAPVQEREHVCVCVCVCVRERERERERERVCVCVCMHVCVREREQEKCNDSRLTRFVI